MLPFRLRPFFSPRPWGRRDLSPWYTVSQTGVTEEPIGEAWLTGPKAVVETGPLAEKTLAEIGKEHAKELLGDWVEEEEFPLLVKLLFPDEKLSVQVHPDDAKAQQLGQKRGKTECWYTLQADPGAVVFCGLKPGVTEDALRASVQDNTMENLLTQIPVQVGEMVFVDAGTVHAIGPGLTLLETQQTSDTTYRMYDYGRPRELHLEQGIAAMKTKTDAGLVAPQALPIPEAHGARLIQQKYFTVDRFELNAGESITLKDALGKPHCVIPVSGTAWLKDDQGTEIELLPGTATIVPATAGIYTLVANQEFACVRSMP